MNIRITPSPLHGRIAAIASKSDAHRLLILAALSRGTTVIRIPELSADIEATVRCLSALGAEISRDGRNFIVQPVPGKTEICEAPLLDCGESGSTLRFLLPAACALRDEISFAGHGRLPERPLDGLLSAMEEHGVRFSSRRLPLTARGRLTGGDYILPGNVSSQYVSGVLMALPLVGGGRIRLSTPLESAAYAGMTVSSMTRFGMPVSCPSDREYQVGSGLSYISPGETAAESDWSNAAFFLSAGALGGELTVTGLSAASLQPDRAVLPLLSALGADVREEPDGITVSGSSRLKGCTIDVSGCPDLLPVLAMTAAYAEGTTRFTGGRRLRFKESDRLSAVGDAIRALSGDAEETPDGLIVRGRRLSGGTVDGRNDHRIVMAAAAAASRAGGPVTILGAEAVEKSYPRFFSDFRSLGGMAEIL